MQEKNPPAFYWIALNCAIIYHVLYGLSCMQGKQDNNEEEKIRTKIIFLAYVRVHVLCK